MRIMIAAMLLGGAMASPALANGPVALESAVFIESASAGEGGRMLRMIEPARSLVRGDRVVLMVEWQAASSDDGFYVTNPVPRTLAFQRSSRDGQQVSVDGGRNWGQLGALRIRDSYGARLATPEDVTHVRWQITADQAARGSGRITYSAIVR